MCLARNVRAAPDTVSAARVFAVTAVERHRAAGTEYRLRNLGLGQDLRFGVFRENHLPSVLILSSPAPAVNVQVWCEMNTSFVLDVD